MLELAAITYGALASFVFASAKRNAKEARGNPPILTLFALTLMAFSAVMATLLLGYAGWSTLTVA